MATYYAGMRRIFRPVLMPTKCQKRSFIVVFVVVVVGSYWP